MVTKIINVQDGLVHLLQINHKKKLGEKDKGIMKSVQYIKDLIRENKARIVGVKFASKKSEENSEPKKDEEPRGIDKDIAISPPLQVLKDRSEEWGFIPNPALITKELKVSREEAEALYTDLKKIKGVEEKTLPTEPEHAVIGEKKIESEENQGDYTEVLRLTREIRLGKGIPTSEEKGFLDKYKNLADKIVDIESRRKRAISDVDEAKLIDRGPDNIFFDATIPSPDQIDHIDLRYRTKKEMLDAVKNIYDEALAKLGLETSAREEVVSPDADQEDESEQIESSGAIDRVIAKIERLLAEKKALLEADSKSDEDQIEVPLKIIEPNNENEPAHYNDGDRVAYGKEKEDGVIKIQNDIEGKPRAVQLIDYTTGLLVAERLYEDFNKVKNEQEIDEFFKR